MARATFNGLMPLTGEEAYYWSWSLQLDWSYFDHPPLIAWLIRAVTSLAGRSVFAIRLTALGCHLVGALAVYACVRRLTRDTARAAWAGLVFTSVIFFAAMATLILPDSVLFACWALALWLILEATFLGRKGAWPLAGIALGLCALAKFHAILLALALLLFLVISRKRARYFREPRLYVAGAIALAMTFPIFYWNVREGWPTFGFQLAQRHRIVFPSPIYFIEMLSTPLAYVGPVLFPLCVAGTIWGFKEWRRHDRDDLLFLALACAVPFLFFLTLSIFLRIDPQWAAPGFISGSILAALLGAELVRDTSRPKWLRRCLPIAIGTNLLLTLLAYGALLTVMAHPFLTGEHLRAIPHRPKTDASRIGRMYGWDEIGESVRDEITLLGGPEKAFIYAQDGFGSASSYRYYSGEDVQVYMWKESPYKGLQFAIWEGRAHPIGMNAIIISRKEQHADPARFRPYFRRLEYAPDIVVARGGQEQQRYYVLRAWDLLSVPSREN
jgi:hypothetical protein